MADGHAANIIAYPKMVDMVKFNTSFEDFDHLHRGGISNLYARYPNISPMKANAPNMPKMSKSSLISRQGQSVANKILSAPCFSTIFLNNRRKWTSKKSWRIL